MLTPLPSSMLRPTKTAVNQTWNVTSSENGRRQPGVTVDQADAEHSERDEPDLRDQADAHEPDGGSRVAGGLGAAEEDGVDAALEKPGHGDPGPAEQRQVGGDEDRQRGGQHRKVDVPQHAQRHGIGCLQSVRRQGVSRGSEGRARRQSAPQRGAERYMKKGLCDYFVTVGSHAISRPAAVVVAGVARVVLLLPPDARGGGSLHRARKQSPVRQPPFLRRSGGRARRVWRRSGPGAQHIRALRSEARQNARNVDPASDHPPAAAARLPSRNRRDRGRRPRDRFDRGGDGPRVHPAYVRLPHDQREREP